MFRDKYWILAMTHNAPLAFFHSFKITQINKCLKKKTETLLNVNV